MDKSRFHKELLILLLLLSLGIRLLGLNWQPLWWDEGYSLYASTMPIGAMIVETAEDIHPPLYYAFLHLWQGLAGTDPVSVRLFSVFVGTLVVLVVFLIARRIGGPALAWFAGLIAAVNPLLVYYSQEVRMYALTTLLGLISAYLMFLWLENQSEYPGGRSGSLLLGTYVAVTAAALYTHYYSVFIPVAQTLFVWAYHRGQHLRRRWLLCQGILAALYLPWILFTLTKLTSYVSGKVSIEQSNTMGPLAFLEHHLSAFALGHLPAEWNSLYWVSLPFLALVIVGIMKGQGVVIRKTENKYWPTLIAASLLGAFLVNVAYPFNPRGFERLILFAAPAYCMLVATGCLYLWERKRILGGFACVLLLAGSGVALWPFYTTPRYTEDDYRPLIARVRASAWQDDAVLCLYPWQIGYFQSYYGDGVPQLEASFRQDWPARDQDSSLLPDYVNNLMASNARIWFPAHQTGGRILEGELADYMAQNYYTAVSEWANPHTRLFLFGNAPGLDRSETAINFGNRLQLAAYGVNLEPVSSDGGTIAVELDWRLTSELSEPYYVGLRLADEMGYTWVQRAAEPVGGLRPFSEWVPGEVVRDRHGLLLPADMPPGKYQIKVGVYRRSDGRGLDVLNPAGVPIGVEADVGAVEVVLPPAPPDLDRLQIPQPRSIDLESSEGAAIRFLGYSLLGYEYAPGESLALALFWQPLTVMDSEGLVNLQLVDRNGNPIVSQAKPAVMGRYPMDEWTAGYALRDPQQIVFPPDTPPGDYMLRVGLAESERGHPFSVKGSDEAFIDLQMIRVTAGRSHDFDRPQIPRELEAVWGNSIQLLGHDPLPDAISPGETVTLTLYWQALERMQTPYTVFIHFLDTNQVIRGQIDSPPGTGTLPTTGWIPGEYLKDSYTFRVQTDAPDGNYKIEIGIYDPATGFRLPVGAAGQAEESDHILLPMQITVPAK